MAFQWIRKMTLYTLNHVLSVCVTNLTYQSIGTHSNGLGICMLCSIIM